MGGNQFCKQLYKFIFKKIKLIIIGIFLFKVWYNAELTEPSRKRLCGDLEVLLNGKLPKRVNLTQKNLSVLQDIWRKWRSALNVCSLTNPELIKIIQYERYKIPNLDHSRVFE